MGITLSGCDAPKVKQVESPSLPPAPHPSPPAPVPSETPAPQQTPSTASKPTAQGLKKDPGTILYLRKGISITSETGIYRIPPGTAVEVLSYSDNRIRVKNEDGMEAEATEDYFTDSHEEKSAINETQTARNKTMAQKALLTKEVEASRAAETKKLSIEYTARLKSERIGKLQTQISALKSRIDVAERELTDKSNRGYYSRDHWDGYRWVYRSRRTGISLGPDASQIDKLWDHYRASLEQLRRMQSSE